jgi:hypothetical protein
MNSDQLEEGCASLLETAGLGGSFRLTAINEGANNRALRVERVDGLLLLKSYFQHADDPRDRLGTEFAFCTFAWEHGVDVVPRPVAADRARGLGLYEFVEGRRLDPAEVDARAIAQALAFFRALNRHKHSASALRLQSGSEACFSIAEHLSCVDARVRRLAALEPWTDADRAALALVRDRLTPAWESIAGALRHQAGGDLELRLDQDERCLSPSDFGFHNALCEASGRLRFLDFEYAGWDDPAKLVCDFFCQPALPVPRSSFDAFAVAVVQDHPRADRHLRRIRELFPVYQVKWCCILLNDFLPMGRARRRFASSAADPELRKTEQLEKARRALGQLELMSIP